MHNSLLGHLGLQDLLPRFDLCKRALARLADLCGNLVVRSGELGEHALTEDIAKLEAQLEAPFSILVCGELNVGKSSLINSLVGSLVCPVGVVPTTAKIETFDLEGLVLLDSPGFNSVSEAMRLEVKRVARTVDTIIFVVSVERPVSLAERDFIQEIIEVWNRRVVLVVHKVDLCTVSEAERVKSYIEGVLDGQRKGLLSVVLTSTRLPETIVGLRQQLLSIFSERIRREAKINAVVEAMAIVGQSAVSALERESFRLACAQRETEAASAMLGTCQRTVGAAVLPSVSELAVFDDLEVQLAEYVRRHWSIGGVVFGGALMDRLCEAINSASSALHTEYLENLPEVLHQQQLFITEWVQRLVPQFVDDACVDNLSGAAESTDVLSGNEGVAFDTLKARVKAWSARARKQMALALLFPVLVPCLLLFDSLALEPILILEVVALLVPLWVSRSQRLQGVNLVALFTLQARRDFVAAVNANLARLSGDLMRSAKEALDRVTEEQQRERDLLDSRIAALKEFVLSFGELMYPGSSPLFGVQRSTGF